MQGKIREATANDAQQISDIAYQSKGYWGYSQAFMEACKAELSVTPAQIDAAELTYMVLETNTRVVGFYAIEKQSSAEAELNALFVLPDYIGQGIGKALIKHALNYAKQHNIRSLNVQSDPHAEPFYLAAGATPVGKQESGSIRGRYLPVLVFTLE